MSQNDLVLSHSAAALQTCLEHMKSRLSFVRTSETKYAYLESYVLKIKRRVFAEIYSSRSSVCVIIRSFNHYIPSSSLQFSRSFNQYSSNHPFVLSFILNLLFRLILSSKPSETGAVPLAFLDIHLGK